MANMQIAVFALASSGHPHRRDMPSTVQQDEKGIRWSASLELMSSISSSHGWDFGSRHSSSSMFPTSFKRTIYFLCSMIGWNISRHCNVNKQG